MKVVEEDIYEEIAATYQCLEIARINEILKQNGIEDKSLREKICEDFIFDSGNFVDSGHFTLEGKILYPKICFLERFNDKTENSEETNNLLVPSANFAFHEYAFGNISRYFDELEESMEDIKNGSV